MGYSTGKLGRAFGLRRLRAAGGGGAPRPAFTSITPSIGATLGGTNVTIAGAYFVATPTVTVGGVSATSIVCVSSTSITCTTPAGAAGAADVVITNPDAQTRTAPGAFTYAVAPTFTSVVAAIGASAGGTAVTITGTGFSTSPAVTFGGVTATSIVRVSSTEITCVTPAHAVGAVSVRVTNSDTLFVSAPDAFTYAAPVVSSTSPNNGKLAAGTAVTITGLYFSASISGVTFDGAAATSVVRVSSTSITCVAPAGSSGTADVVVTNSDAVTSGTTGNAKYTYNPFPTLTSVTPNTGSPAGGTSVTLAGTGFISGAAVFFGGLDATSESVVSGTSITCVTPAHTSGAVLAQVFNPDLQYADLASGFTYNAPTVSSISPQYGTRLGGTAVTITGTNFTGATSAAIGGVNLTSFTVVNSTTITGTTASFVPGGMADAARDVTVVNGSSTGTLASGFFTFTPGDYTGLALFWDAATGTSTTTNGAAIDTWTERAASRVASAVSTARPTYTASAQNGKPGVTFDGINDVMTGTMTAFTTCTMVFAAKFNGSVVSSVPIELQPALSAYQGVTFYHDGASSNNNILFRIGDSATLKAESVGAYKVFSAEANTSLGRIWNDGAIGTNSTGTVTLGSLDNFQLGAQMGPTAFFAGTMLMACVYSVILSDANRIVVQNFQKWLFNI